MRTSVVFVAFLAALAVAAGPAVVEWKDPKGAVRTGSMSTVYSGYTPCDPGVTQMSGYFNIQASTNKNYFYWAVQSRGAPATDPVLLWMTGGPGCSSSLALLLENGPCKVAANLSVYNNPYSWNNYATVIYIDQPAGVGFSTASMSGYDDDEQEVADDMYNFIQAFYMQFPQFKPNKFFISGESYGGHYAPATAYRVLQGNQAGTGFHIPLTGVTLGNGLVDPEIQYQYYAQLAYNWCQTILGEPCVSRSAYEQMKAAIPQCTSLINSCTGGSTGLCGIALNYCESTQMGPFEETGRNVYDFRKPCIGQLCYNMQPQISFMNMAAVQTALGVPSHIQWSPCNLNVNSMFTSKDKVSAYDYTIPHLLSNNIRVLVYAGDVDFICNWIGNKAWATALNWSGKAAFNAMQDATWSVSGQTAGWVRTVPLQGQTLGYTFLQVHLAGHMVPMDQPANAADMIRRFLGDMSYTA